MVSLALLSRTIRGGRGGADVRTGTAAGTAACRGIGKFGKIGVRGLEMLGRFINFVRLK